MQSPISHSKPHDMSVVGHESGEQYEAEHVHAVYEQIASHFSSTRYKVSPEADRLTSRGQPLNWEQPWPIIEGFLKVLPDGSIGLDVGCGNGKYLAVNRNVFIVGSDRSVHSLPYERYSLMVLDKILKPRSNCIQTSAT